MATITIFGETQEEIAAALGAITYAPPPQIKEPSPDLDENAKELDRLKSDIDCLRVAVGNLKKQRDMMVAGIKHVADKLKKIADTNPLTSAPTLVEFVSDLMSFIPKEAK